ncbi:ABC transporter permease subunit [Tautonia sociabilis]|uniref:Transcriptional regulator n=1 Tax=Tautonia sociabilis TaxID=2080755 RepID=A0A432MM89_9BACT|nr:ABC transporter permease subunit [Tautonia sociabilis]RUL88236.1 transcriptional regulator [Tautonia sociabilis]
MTGFSCAFWLVRDTFRQAQATRLSRLILAMSALCVALCLSIRIDPGPPLRPEGEIELYGADGLPLDDPSQRPGRLAVGFGGLEVPLFRGAEDEVRFLRVILAKWVAGAAGTLLALVWAASFLPEFLRPESSALLLAKPVPRWHLLMGKYVGTVAFVAAQAAVFVGGTWLALGIRSGDWDPTYLLCLPLLAGHFAVVYAASSLIAVCTRSASAASFGSIVFWCLCFAMNRGRHLLVASAGSSGEVGSPFREAVELGYWILPKPADFVALLDRAMGAGDHFSTLAEVDAVGSLGAFHPGLSLAASAAFAAALLAAAAREFGTIDY